MTYPAGSLIYTISETLFQRPIDRTGKPANRTASNCHKHIDDFEQVAIPGWSVNYQIDKKVNYFCESLLLAYSRKRPATDI